MQMQVGYNNNYIEWKVMLLIPLMQKAIMDRHAATYDLLCI